jgi:hypothetical protein
MEDVDINDETSGKSTSNGHLKSTPSLHGIYGRLLRVALDNQEDFYRLYETLTDKALRHYTVANHVQSVQSSMADLAVLKYHLEDYGAAASYLYRMTPFYGEDGWTQIELSLLIMYAKCLKELQRKDDYVRIALKLLSRAANAEKERIALKSMPRSAISSLNHEELVPDEPYLADLLQITRTFQREVQVPLQNFFSQAEVDGTARYHSGKDSFALQIRLRYLLDEDICIDKGVVRITPSTGDAGREIWLETGGPIIFKKGIVKFVVQSNVSCQLFHTHELLTCNRCYFRTLILSAIFLSMQITSFLGMSMEILELHSAKSKDFSNVRSSLFTSNRKVLMRNFYHQELCT